MNQLALINLLHQPIRNNNFYQDIGIDTIYGDSLEDVSLLVNALSDLLQRREHGILNRLLEETDFRWLNLMCISTIFHTLAHHVKILPKYEVAMQRAVHQVRRRHRDPMEVLKGAVVEVKCPSGETTYRIVDDH